MPKAIPLDCNSLNQLYHVENRTLYEVAEHFGVCRDTVARCLKRCGLPRKTPGVYRIGQNHHSISLLPKAKELYIDKQQPFMGVCETLGTSFVTLRRLFLDNGVAIRSSGEAVRLAYKQHPSMGFKTGDKHPRFNGYRTNETRTGYIRVYKPDDSRCSRNGYIGEHILVWEDTHNMPLPEGWVVHHLNGIKNDNRPVNLVGLPNRTHHRVLAEKAKRIKTLEHRVTKLEQTVLDMSKMNLP